MSLADNARSVIGCYLTQEARVRDALVDVAVDICQARVMGTFAAHPLIMGSMNEFLRWVTTPAARDVYSRVGTEFDR